MEIKVNNELTQKVEDIQLNNNISLVNIIDLIRPIGSLYWSENNTNPSTIYPGTTWVQITDTFIVAAGSTYEAGSSYGAASHTHTSAAHTHTTGNHTLTIDEMPQHYHLMAGTFAKSEHVDKGPYWVNQNQRYLMAGHNLTNIDVGSDSTSSRIFAGDLEDRPITDYTGTGGAHNHGDTGLTTPGDTGSSSNIPPSIAMYCWKRTA